MQRCCLLIAIIAVLAATGCRPRPGAGTASELRFRVQFAGTEKLATDTNATTLLKIAELPATQALRDATALRLFTTWQQLLQPATNPVATNVPALLKPLWDRAIQRGFIWESHGTGERTTASLLAVRLQGDEARQWETNFLAAARELDLGRPKKLSTKSFGGWNITRPDRSFIDYLELSKWVVIGVGTDRQPMIDALHKIESVAWPDVTPTNVWFAAEMDGRQLGGFLGTTNTADWPRVDLKVTGRNGNSFIEGRLQYPAALALNLPAWNLPTNLVRDPLISFAAARGIAPWLRGRPEFRQLDLAEAPDQFFLWAQTQVPFQTYAAAPATSAMATLDQLQKRLPAVVERTLQNLAQGIEWNSNHTALVWQRLPLIQPRLTVVTNDGAEFLYGGLFPERPRALPMPGELAAQLERPNLVYYDWEITQERLLQWRHLTQIWQMIARSPVPARALASQAWIEAAAPFLGNTVTELSIKNDHELAFIRKSSLGFTGFELMSLARKLDAFIAPPDPAATQRRAAPPIPMPGQ